MLNESVFTRRKALAALRDAFKRVGIPEDWIVFPLMDDPELLLVVNDREVRWLDGPEGRRRATVVFTSSFEGFVVGDNIHVAVDSDAFYGEDYGFQRPFGFQLSFDISDHPEIETWRVLPVRPLRSRPRQPSSFKAKRAAGR